MKTILVNPKRLVIMGFFVTLPALIFWGAVAISRFFHDPHYVDEMLSYGGVYIRFALVGLFPVISFAIALACRKAIRLQAISRNEWHRETNEMKVNQSLINWNVILLSAMVISLINN